MLTADDYKQIVRTMLQPDDAGLYTSTVGENPPIRYLTIPLDVANTLGAPYVVTSPFRSFVVLFATDASVYVNMQLGSQESSVDAFPVRNNSSLSLPFPVQKAFLSWPAQPGKVISILFFTRGTFATNQLVSNVSASVNLSDGGSIATQSGAQVTAVAAQLFAADSGRNNMLIQNQSGASIWLGSDATLTLPGGAKPGFEVGAGAFYEWRTTAACYAIASVATAATAISLTKFSA